MKILSYNPGHDGAIAFLQGARLMMSIESEKDSNYRYSNLSIDQALDIIGELEEMPEIICMGGWWPRDHHEYLYGSLNNFGYRGVSKNDFIVKKAAF
jgi:hydroxymethyl cephem carbamoyltransferase